MQRRLHEYDPDQSMEAAMTAQTIDATHTGEDARAQLLASMPVTERWIELAGISTAVLEGGQGPPLVLLHGPAEHAAKWFTVVPRLAQSYRIVAPDLPGHGASVVPTGAIEADRVLDWLSALIGETCARPPALVAQILGGAIAARFAGQNSDRLSQLVLSDTLGLTPFDPAPAFGRALAEYMANPNEETHDSVWRHCALDLGRLRAQMGAGWDRIRAYNLDRARTPALHATQQSLMAQFGLPEIPPAELECISTPTSLIWGRHNRAIPLSVAESASKRYGWPLHVIEDAADDPPIEQPEAFLKALDRALGRP
jgi:pimeloyl-ACP methyl ester carboxylesterase